ncbi:hypothetical protein ABIE35_000599 [Paenarthrobacter sp. 4246]
MYLRKPAPDPFQAWQAELSAHPLPKPAGNGALPTGRIQMWCRHVVATPQMVSSDSAGTRMSGYLGLSA